MCNYHLGNELGYELMYKQVVTFNFFVVLLDLHFHDRNDSLPYNVKYMCISIILA